MGSSSRYASTCEMCGQRVRTGSTLCRPCYTRKPASSCGTCGKTLANRRSTQCRTCWRMRNGGPKSCSTCGKRLPIGSQGTNCWSCHSANARTYCETCGAEMPSKSRGKKCWSCHLIARRAAAGSKRCSRPGCDQPHQAKGYCMNHYQHFVVRAKERRQGINGPERQVIREQPCAVCGYDRMPSEPHRVVPGGPYEFGNMVPVCARCHDEIERGLTPCPPPWRPDI